MATLEIIKLPDPRLREKAAPVTEFNAELKTLSENMVETMHSAKGIGLAAVQIAVMKRLLVIDIGDLDLESEREGEEGLSKKRKVHKPELFVNPEILERSGEIEYEEGCLSIPGVYANVKRNQFIKLRYQDLKGQSHEINAEGMKAIVLQHEIDHLDGILFPDRIGPMQRMMLLEKYKKLQSRKP